jgi:hypothetical protein
MSKIVSASLRWARMPRKCVAVLGVKVRAGLEVFHNATLCRSRLSSGTSPERIAPESLTPVLSGFVHRNIMRSQVSRPLDQVSLHQTSAALAPKSLIAQPRLSNQKPRRVKPVTDRSGALRPARRSKSRHERNVRTCRGQGRPDGRFSKRARGTAISNVVMAGLVPAAKNCHGRKLPRAVMAGPVPAIHVLARGPKGRGYPAQGRA